MRKRNNEKTFVLHGIKLILKFKNRYTYSRKRQWQPTPVFLPGKSHGQRSLVGSSTWGCEESDTTEQLHFHFSLSCIGEGNRNPLQYSCLENPRAGGAWWAAVYGVAQSRTRLKQLSIVYILKYTFSILFLFWNKSYLLMLLNIF